MFFLRLGNGKKGLFHGTIGKIVGHIPIQIIGRILYGNGHFDNIQAGIIMFSIKEFLHGLDTLSTLQHLSGQGVIEFSKRFRLGIFLLIIVIDQPGMALLCPGKKINKRGKLLLPVPGKDLGIKNIRSLFHVHGPIEDIFCPALKGEGRNFGKFGNSMIVPA